MQSMMNALKSLFGCATLALLLVIGSSAQSSANKVVVAYVPNWIDIAAFASTIDYSQVTHLNVAFENPKNDTGDLTFSLGTNTLIAKAHAHHVSVQVSIGGGSASSSKKDRQRIGDLMSGGKRGAFIAKLNAYIRQHHFDGIDIDIEGPAINKDYGAFMRDLSVALKSSGKLLTTALSQGYGGDQVPSYVLDVVDFVNIMAYDGAGPWDKKSPGQHSSYEFAKSNVDYWLKRGLVKSKAVLGLPFYGYGFGKAYRDGDFPYAEIVAAYKGAENLDQTGETIWYNGLGTIKLKTQYVIDSGLAGVMIWSLDEDCKGEKSLLAAIHSVLIAAPIPVKEVQ